MENFCRRQKIGLKPKEGTNAIEAVVDATSDEM